MIRESPSAGVYVEKLREESVVNPEQVFSLLSKGQAWRHTGKTNYNEVSSRSHTIFRMKVESVACGAGATSKQVRSSTLSLADCAGSESVLKAGSAARQKETGYINRSLVCLTYTQLHMHIYMTSSTLYHRVKHLWLH